MSGLLGDLGHAARLLRRNPGVTLVAVTALALGIGANTALFSVVDAVLLKPLPYPGAERLVMAWQNDTHHDTPREWVSPANFLDWRRQARTFERLAAFTSRPFNLTGAGEPERLDGERVSADLFPALGVRAAIGRVFLAEEDREGAGRVVVLSHGLWQRRFGADPRVVGAPLTLDGEAHTVVGVMPPGFRFPGPDVALWVPLAMDGREAGRRRSLILRVVGRLGRGVSFEQARAEMTTIASRLERSYPEANSGTGITLVPLREEIVGDVRAALLVLLGAVGCVLLIACTNVAALLLSRATARQKEMAVRAALGAGRWRIMRQLLTESLLLAVAGGALGTLLALWGVDLLQAAMPADIPRHTDIAVDGRVLAFTLAVSMLTGVAFGVVPAAQASRPDLHDALREGPRASAGRGRLRARSLLVVSEVALALVLLVGAGLLIRSFARLKDENPGFVPDRLLTMRMELPERTYGEAPARLAFYRGLLERVTALPGVRSAGVITFLPLTFRGATFAFLVEGRPVPPSGREPYVVYRVVSPGYFRTLGIPLRRGRLLTEGDDERAPLVTVINETMARRHFPGEDPIGRRMTLGVGPPDAGSEWLEIVGVAGDVRQFDLDAEPRPEIYVPYPQESLLWFVPRDLAVRAAGDPLALAPAVRAAVRALDPDQPIARVRTMEQILSEALARRRSNTILLGAFAAVALTLAAVGIYGVVAYSVTQRTREIGIRVALGARRRDVLRLVLGQGARLALAGVALGVAGALALTRLMAGLLYEVSPADPATFCGTAALLVAVALLACYLPARRAARVDPMVALRCE